MNKSPSPDHEEFYDCESEVFANDAGESKHKSKLLSNKPHNSNGNVKRYSRSSLYLLRNEPRSRRRPECALRSDLQGLAVWTCRLRCELQSLGVWKSNTSNTSSQYANNSCSNTNNSGNNVAVHNEGLGSGGSSGMVAASSSATKRAIRSRERWINYQRYINIELGSLNTGSAGATPLVGTTPLLPGGSNHSSANNPKTYIDHRSISSSHLMPDFVKRRTGTIPAVPVAVSSPSSECVDVESNSVIANRSDEHATNSDGSLSPNLQELTLNRRSNAANSSKSEENTVASTGRKTIAKPKNVYDSEYPEDHPYWMSLVQKINGEFESPRNNSSTNNSNSRSNSSINSCTSKRADRRERRIGSGRLIPRDVSWDYRSSGSIKKDNFSPPDLSRALNVQQHGNGRYSESKANERTFVERRSYERKTSGGKEETNRDKYDKTNSARRFASNTDVSNSVEPFSNHKQSQQSSHRRGYRTNQYNDQRDEPEWFSGGPKSQHDTIELRGFEELDEIFSSGALNEQRSSNQSNREQSESSSSHTGSTINLSTLTKTKDHLSSSKECLSSAGVSGDEKIHKCDKIQKDNDSTNVLYSSDNSENTAPKNIPNIAEFNFDTFLNIDPLEHSLMGGDKTLDGIETGSSRFSRWFSNKTDNNEDLTSPPNKSENKNDVGATEAQNRDETNFLMAFLKNSKLPTPDSQKSLLQHAIPSVEELEARMRKMDTIKTPGESNKLAENEGNTSGKNALSDVNESPVSQMCATSTQDVVAFRKILDQLGSGNSTEQLTNMPANIMRLPTATPTVVPPMETTQGGLMTHQVPFHTLKQEEALKQQQQVVHHQKLSELLPPEHQVQHQQMTPQQPINENVGMLPPQVPALFAGYSQKRMEVQHLLQSVARGETSLHYLERALKSPRITPHAKEVICAVLKESSHCATPSFGPSNMAPIVGNNQQQIQSPIPTNVTESSTIAQPIGNNSTVILPGNDQQILLDGQQSLPSPRELQYHTQAVIQNALLKKKLEEQQTDAFRRRHENLKQQQVSQINMQGLGDLNAQHSNMQLMQTSPTATTSPAQNQSQILHSLQRTRHDNSPTPLAFTPTSVLRKMTADKDNINSQQQTSAIQLPQQHQQQQLQQQLLQNKSLAQNTYVKSHANFGQTQTPQPRMILGGSHQLQQPPQMSPNNSSFQTTPQQQQAQMRNTPHMKWPGHMMNPNMMNVNKPMGRPILKGPLHIISPQHQQQQPAQSMPHMAFASKIEYQQIQQQRLKNNQTTQQIQPLAQTFQHSTQYPSQNHNVSGHIQHQKLAQQRSIALHRQQMQQQQQIDANIRSIGISSPNESCSLPSSSASGLMNYQRDGCLSPTSNQLAQWFSPELLAQASAGKLPLLNINQALSLEEFERSIQHSSTAVHN